MKTYSVNPGSTSIDYFKCISKNDSTSSAFLRIVSNPIILHVQVKHFCTLFKLDQMDDGEDAYCKTN